MTAESVPDARISARFSWWFETKTERGAYSTEGHGRVQLRGHARQLEADRDAVLFVLTPDPVQPNWFDVLDGIDPALRPRVAWVGFRGIADAIDDVLADPRRLVAEQTRFLLAELRAFYEADGLLTHDDVVVVAARLAWDNYRDYAAYACQPNRSFKEGLRYFGFYRRGRIEVSFPQILRWVPAVLFTREHAEALSKSADPLDVKLGEVILLAIASGARSEHDTYGVMLLTAEDDERTFTLSQPIENDSTTAAGRPWAWTLSQRYTSIERLRRRPTHTSQL